MAMQKRGGLGKGLEALFIDNETAKAETASMLRISEVEPNREQPRADFDEDSLAELSESIRLHGVLTPILVRPLPGGRYQIIAGERRWRAARMAGLSQIPAVVREADDRQTMELALVENLQRDDLNPMEEALGYQMLSEQYGLTQEEIADRVGRSRPAVTNAMRLLSLPGQVTDMVRKGELSAGQARAILALPEAVREETAARAVREGLTVRQLERLSEKPSSAENRKKKAVKVGGDNFYREMEVALRQELHRGVAVRAQGDKGSITIDFYSREELADIAARLTKHQSLKKGE
jgi:ParB family chromosome partitioning protein